jgi:GxxExxY protein
MAAVRIPFRRKVTLPVVYDQVYFDSAYVADIIVADEVVLEIKSVETLLPVHHAQLLTTMRLAPCRLGLLLNFNITSLTQGLKRRIL